MLGLIGNKSYAEEVADRIRMDTKSAYVTVKKEGNYYRVYADFADKATAKAVFEKLIKDGYIVNYYYL